MDFGNIQDFGIMDVGINDFGIMAYFGITDFGIMADFGITDFGIMADFGIMDFGITDFGILDFGINVFGSPPPTLPDDVELFLLLIILCNLLKLVFHVIACSTDHGQFHER